MVSKWFYSVLIFQSVPACVGQQPALYPLLCAGLRPGQLAADGREPQQCLARREGLDQRGPRGRPRSRLLHKVAGAGNMPILAGHVWLLTVWCPLPRYSVKKYLLHSIHSVKSVFYILSSVKKCLLDALSVLSEVRVGATIYAAPRDASRVPAGA